MRTWQQQATTSATSQALARPDSNHQEERMTKAFLHRNAMKHGKTKRVWRVLKDESVCALEEIGFTGVCRRMAHME
jgi:hypothetical protein